MAYFVDDSNARPVQTVLAWIFTIITGGYLLPWAIAATRGKSNTGTIFWINLLLGWTIIGWIVALVMSLSAHKIVGLIR